MINSPKQEVLEFSETILLTQVFPPKSSDIIYLSIDQKSQILCLLGRTLVTKTTQNFFPILETLLIEFLSSFTKTTIRLLRFFIIQKVPSFSYDLLTATDIQFLNQYFAKFDEYLAALELTDIKDGLRKAMELSSSINKYL